MFYDNAGHSKNKNKPIDVCIYVLLLEDIYKVLLLVVEMAEPQIRTARLLGVVAGGQCSAFLMLSRRLVFYFTKGTVRLIRRTWGKKPNVDITCLYIYKL